MINSPKSKSYYTFETLKATSNACLSWFKCISLIFIVEKSESKHLILQLSQMMVFLKSATFECLSTAVFQEILRLNVFKQYEQVQNKKYTWTTTFFLHIDFLILQRRLYQAFMPCASEGLRASRHCLPTRTAKVMVGNEFWNSNICIFAFWKVIIWPFCFAQCDCQNLAA